MVKRGEIWTVSGGPDFAGKSRLAGIVQDKLPERIDPISLCPLTSRTDLVSQCQLPVRPDAENGLRHLSQMVVEKTSSVKARKIGQGLGVLTLGDRIELERSLAWYRGLLPSDDGHQPEQ